MSTHANAAAGVFGRHANTQLSPVYLYLVIVGHMIIDHMLTSVSLLIVVLEVCSAYVVVPVVTRFSLRVVDGTYLIKKNKCLSELEKKNSNHFDHNSNTFTHAHVFIWPQDSICLSRLNLYRQACLNSHTHTHTCRVSKYILYAFKKLSVSIFPETCHSQRIVARRLLSTRWIVVRDLRAHKHTLTGAGL